MQKKIEKYKRFISTEKRKNFQVNDILVDTLDY